jgi:hypothetical protein
VSAALRAWSQPCPLWVADSTGGCNTLDAIKAKGVLRMKQRPRICYSACQRALIWERWLKGDIKVYFCDPQSPWQRGSTENANGLLRQYLPKGIDLSAYSQAKLNAIARRLYVGCMKDGCYGLHDASIAMP